MTSADSSTSKPPVWPQILDKCVEVRLGPETTVFDVGSPCENFLFLQSGAVRVQAHTRHERELLLYRVHANESCVLTTSCLFADETYPAEGVTDTEICALLLPRVDFFHGLETSSDFRKLVFTSYAKRLCHVIRRLQQITASRIDVRLAGLLLRLGSTAAQDDVVITTQQDLAMEIGSSREVVTRELRRFQSNGLIETGRGKIRILDRAGLERVVTP